MTNHLYANLLDIYQNDANWSADWNANLAVLKDALRTLKFTITIQGGHTSASTVTIQLQDAVGANVLEPFALRVRIADNNGYGNATHATFVVGGSTTVLETHTATKDLTVLSDNNGLVTLVCSDSTIETFMLLTGMPPTLGRAGIVNYNNSKAVVHA